MISLAKCYDIVIFVQELSFLISGVAIPFVNSKLCKFKIKNDYIFLNNFWEY